MDLEGTISTVGHALCSFISSRDVGQVEQRDSNGSNERDHSLCECNNSDGGMARAELFALDRFFAKLERPDSTRIDSRRKDAWVEWIDSDSQLQPVGMFKPNWALAKLFIADVLRDFTLGPVSFTNGSEFTATRGFNSIESKLKRSEWTCSYDNFDLWARTVYGHRALKVATRKRLAKLLATMAIDEKNLNRFLYKHYSKQKSSVSIGKRVFSFKLSMVTKMVQGNRFSTVPKNNLVDRPICIEPLANILVQRRIGQGIRTCLNKLGVDLNTTAELHRGMISIPKYATIDLKNASDRISLKLCKYLLPARVFKFIEAARSEMTLGPDDDFYIVNKVSSMGNGFTFELMSLILYALCRSYTVDTSVFGDDIVIPNEFALPLIGDLENAGFAVNMKKTHINSDYRESCGSHFIDGVGYIESYDFRFPTNIGEVITIVNKLSRLSLIYPKFIPIFCKVYSLVPAALLADNPEKAIGEWRQPEKPLGSPKLDTFIVRSPFQFRKDGIPVKPRMKRRIREYCARMQLDPKHASMHYGFEWRDARPLVSNLNASNDWAKILMYLQSGRRCADTVRGKGTFKSFLCVTLRDGTTFRWSAHVAT